MSETAPANFTDGVWFRVVVSSLANVPLLRNSGIVSNTTSVVPNLFFRVSADFDASTGSFPLICDSETFIGRAVDEPLRWSRLCDFGPLAPDDAMPLNLTFQLMLDKLLGEDVLFAAPFENLPDIFAITNQSALNSSRFGSLATGFSPLHSVDGADGGVRFEWRVQVFCTGDDCLQASDNVAMLAFIATAAIVGVVGGVLSLVLVVCAHCRAPKDEFSEEHMHWHDIHEEVVTFSVEFAAILLLGITDAELDLKIAFWVVTLLVATVMPHIACCYGPSLEHGGVLALGVATSVISIVHLRRATAPDVFFSAKRARLIGITGGFVVGLGITCLVFAIAWFPFVFRAWRARRRANREAGIEEKSAFDGLRQTICCTWLFNCRCAAVDQDEFERESTGTTHRFLGAYSMFWLVSLFGLDFVTADTFTSGTTFALILLGIAALFTLFVMRTRGQLSFGMVALYLVLAVLTNLFVICSLLSDFAIVRSNTDLGAVTGTLVGIVVVGSLFICCSCAYLIAFRIRIRRRSTKKQDSPESGANSATTNSSQVIALKDTEKLSSARSLRVQDQDE
jgi:hypothetical protein